MSILKRWRRLVKTELSAEFIREKFLEDPEVGGAFDLDNQLSLWRDFEVSQANSPKNLDFLREFVECQIENKIYVPKDTAEEVSVIYKHKERPILIPNCDLASTALSFADNAILLQDNNLFYWQYSELVTDKEISFNLVYTKSCSKNQFITMNLEEFLHHYSIDIDDLA